MSKQHKQVNSPEVKDMKLTFTSIMCGPEGNAFPGTVLDIPKERMQPVTVDGETKEVPLADYLIQNKFARPFDAQLDRKARVGLSKAEK